MQIYLAAAFLVNWWFIL